MHRLLLSLVVLAVSCSSSQPQRTTPPTPKPSAEELEAAARADTDEAAAAHRKRFPEDARRLAEERAARERERILTLRDVTAVQIVYEYTEAGKPAEFPEPVDAALRELCAHAGWTVGEGGLAITVRGNAASFGIRYNAGVRRRARASFDGTVVFRRGDQLILRRTLHGSRTNAPSPMVVPRHAVNSALDGGLDPVEGVVASPLLRTVVEVVGIAVGPEPLALALRSDLARDQPNTPTPDYMLAGATQSVLSLRKLPGQVEAVRPLLRADDPRIRERAVRALERHWRPDDDADEQERLSFYLFIDADLKPAIGPRGFTEASLDPALAVPRHDIASERVAFLLATLGEPGIDALINRVAASHTCTPYHRALGRCDASAETKLLPLLTSEKPEVRDSAARALVLLRSDRALEYYRTKSRTYDNGLGGYVEQILAVEALVSVVKGKGARGRASAARQLSFTRDPRALDALLAALDEESTELRTSAADTLGWYGDARAIPKLQETARKDASYRQDYARAIWRIEAYGN